MSRRRQSSRPYAGPTRDKLHDVHYGTRERRPNLTVVYRADPDDDYRYDPPFWLGILVMLVLGILLSPLAYGAVVFASMLWATVLP